MNKANEMRQKALGLYEEATTLMSIEDATPEQVERAKGMITEAQSLEARATDVETAEKAAAALRMPNRQAPLPGADSGAGSDADAADAGESNAKGVHVLRYGDIDSNVAAISQEVYGADYRVLAYNQAKAFNLYLRYGKTDPILNRQVWAIDDVKSMLRQDMTVKDVKSTMVEGQDVLGGYAVPPELAAQIISRAAGFTAVRSAGATVIQTASKAIEWLKLTGGNDRYSSALRGSWGNETKNPPDETNMTFGLEQIPVHVYTYKAPFSTSLLEDATNLSEIFVRLVSETLGIDEDEAFLIGSGVGRPRGILPLSANAHSLTEQLSGSSGAMAWAGLKLLRRTVASQYRSSGRASWIANSDTGGDIEGLVDGDTRNYIDVLNSGEMVPTLGGRWLESEAMPDVASNAYAVLYGDFSGYFIVERLGLSVQRYNDSNTGINNVEFHVRRRVGGDVMEPWKLGVQKITA